MANNIEMLLELFLTNLIIVITEFVKKTIITIKSISPKLADVAMFLGIAPFDLRSTLQVMTTIIVVVDVLIIAEAIIRTSVQSKQEVK